MRNAVSWREMFVLVVVSVVCWSVAGWGVVAYSSLGEVLK
jgi:hypothetical protein